MCVRGKDSASVSAIFRLGFGTVLTVWYFLSYTLLHLFHLLVFLS